MDILAHTLWTNAGARKLNKELEKKGKKTRLHVGWTAFWGVFPDLFAFTIPFVVLIWNIIVGKSSLTAFTNHTIPPTFNIAHYLYQYSHSLVIWAVVFLFVWAIAKRPRYELLGWLLHIVIDIPSHSIKFYPTPFLFPLSNYHFPYGIPWSNHWYMIINYSLLIIVWLSIIISKYRKKRNEKI